MDKFHDIIIYNITINYNLYEMKILQQRAKTKEEHKMKPSSLENRAMQIS